MIYCLGWTRFFHFFFDIFKNGPPEAVIIISSISSSATFFVSSIIEKCSESTGNILVLYFLIYFDNISQPQIIASLFAIATTLLNFIASNLNLDVKKKQNLLRENERFLQKMNDCVVWN